MRKAIGDCIHRIDAPQARAAVTGRAFEIDYPLAKKVDLQVELLVQICAIAADLG